MQYLFQLADSITITIVDGNINICIPGYTCLLLQDSLNSIINSLFGSTITLPEASNLGSFNIPKSSIAGNVNHLIPFYQNYQDIVNNIGLRPNIHLNPIYINIYTHFNVNLFLGFFVILALNIKKQVISGFHNKASFLTLVNFSRALLSIILVLFSLKYIYPICSNFKLEDLKGVCIILGLGLKTPIIDTCNFLATNLKPLFFNHVPSYLRKVIVRMAPKIPKGKLQDPAIVGLRNERRSASNSLRRGVEGLNTAVNTLITTLTMNNLSLWRDPYARNGIAVRHNNNGTINGNNVESIYGLIRSIQTHHLNIQDRHTALTNILIRLVQLNVNVNDLGDQDNLMLTAQNLMRQFSALFN